MADTICLDESYSTTQLVTHEKPEIINNPDDQLDTVLLLPEGAERKGEGGLRTKGYFKKSYANKPLISVVTVVYNGEEHLEQTIQSVIEQSYDNVEYVIIDGSSTDGTLDIIKKYEDKIDYWVSESDKGIYDAMNKAINLSSGEWINFMNCGDLFINSEVLIKIIDFLSADIDMIYGNHLTNFETFTRERKASDIELIHHGMPLCHQSMLVRSIVHKKYLYDLKYTICADYDFVATLMSQKYKIKQIDIAISSCRLDGLSDVKNVELLRQMEEISYKYFPIKYNKNIFVFKWVTLVTRNFLKKIFPKNLTKLIQKYK